MLEKQYFDYNYWYSPVPGQNFGYDSSVQAVMMIDTKGLLDYYDIGLSD